MQVVHTAKEKSEVSTVTTPLRGEQAVIFLNQRGGFSMNNSILIGTTKTRAAHRVAMVAGLAVFGATALLAGATVSAQDAAKVDPKHYKVEFENDQVRVLRITYGPHEKGVMHSHPAGVVVYLTDGRGRFTFPGGKTQDVPLKAGTVQWADATTHLPENLGDKGFEVIEVELKAKPGAAR
jgi:quercetin dioxygenase-like cupin family protein